MTLYYSLVFLLLVAEMALFMLLIVPLPFTIRRKMFNFISESPIIAKLHVNRVYRVQLELAESNKQQGSSVLGHERMEVQARKFYSQRNMYLCGFTLFLSLILNRTYTMILEVLRLEEKVKKYEADPKTKSKESEKLINAGSSGEIGKLRALLAEKERDIEILKKQGEGLGREYNKLGDSFNDIIKDTTPKKDR